MRILHVPLPLSRQGNSLFTVAGALGRCGVANGDDVGVVVSHNRDAYVDGIENLSVDYTRYCPREWFTRREKLFDIAAAKLGRRRRYSGDLYRPAIEAAVSWRPDLVLVYEAYFGAPTLPAWRRALPDSALLLYVHSPLARSYGRHELAKAFAACDRIACVSSTLRADVTARVPSEADRVVVVENGVDRSVFRPDGTDADGTGDGVFTLLFAGQVAAHKGPDRMVRALAEAGRLTDRPLKAQIVGSSAYDPADPLSEYEQELRREVDRLGVDVEFLPFVDHAALAGFYRRASVVCVPSTYAEPFGMVVLEAMACGTPVLASERGALPEVGGDAALYVDPDDTLAFGAAIARLADHPELVDDLAARGLQHVEGRSWEAAEDKLVALASTGR